MTPFGLYMREIRKERGISLKKMAADLRISSAYLSALEHGQRSAPSLRLQHAICQYFSIIWDEAAHFSELCQLSEPNPKFDLKGRSAAHFELANRFCRLLPKLDEDQVKHLLKEVQAFDQG